MAYYIHDQDGHVANGPSIGGLKELKKELDANVFDSKKYPQMVMFLHHGYATSPIRFRVECVQLAKLVNDKTVVTSLMSLAEAASKCTGIVIISDSPVGAQ